MVGSWGEKWVPIPNTFMIQTQLRGLSASAMVEDLVDLDTNWWDIQRLRDNFNAEEVKAISSIHISGMDFPDKLVWRGIDFGEFTVRSAYHLAIKIED
jgi:hypothetical protein